MQVSSITKNSRADLQKKHTLAFKLYVDNRLDQKLIAEITGITEKTITTWKKNDKKRGSDWDEERRNALLGAENQMRRTVRMYDQLMTQIENRKKPHNIPNSKEADILSKLSASIEKLRTDITLFAKQEVLKDAISFLQNKYRRNPEKVLMYMEMSHEYLMGK